MSLTPEQAEAIVNVTIENCMPHARESMELWPDFSQMKKIAESGFEGLPEFYEAVTVSIRSIYNAKTHEELNQGIQAYARDHALLEERLDYLGEFSILVALRRMGE